MEIKDRFEFLKEIYFFENQRKENVSASIIFPTNILIGLIITFFFFLEKYPDIKTRMSYSEELVYLASSLFLFVFTCISLSFMVRSYLLLRYVHLGNPVEYNETWKAIENLEVKSSERAMIKEEYMDEVINNLADASKIIQKLNDKRLGHIADSKIISIFTVLSAIFPSVIYFIVTIR